MVESQRVRAEGDEVRPEAGQPVDAPDGEPPLEPRPEGATEIDLSDAELDALDAVIPEDRDWSGVPDIALEYADEDENDDE